MKVRDPIRNFIDVYRTATHKDQIVKFRIVVDDPEGK